MWKQSPQTVSIRHTFTHKKPRYQKLHGAIEGGAAAPSAYPLDPPLVLAKFVSNCQVIG